jgi:integrase
MTGVAGSAHIRVRETKSGRRFVVRFRMGGRAYPLLHGGSFPKQQLAKERRDFILGELAAGRDPRLTLVALANPKAPALLPERFDDFSESRIDVSDKTKALYRNARDRLGSLASRDPFSLTAGDVQMWVAELLKLKLSANTIGQYLSTLRQVLDFCDVEPNPARSRKVKLPAERLEEVSPPTRAEWKAIIGTLRRQFVLPLRLIEATGLRISELLQLSWGDIDFSTGRFRISRARTKRRTAGQRWLPVPSELLEEMKDLKPLEDRNPDGAIFAGISDWQVRHALSRACVDAGVVHRHPHELRHRRISLWIAHGIDRVAVKVWAGHSKASMSEDVYGHVVIDAREDEWRSFWLGVYREERKTRVGELEEVEG